MYSRAETVKTELSWYHSNYPPPCLFSWKRYLHDLHFYLLFFLIRHTESLLSPKPKSPRTSRENSKVQNFVKTFTTQKALNISTGDDDKWHQLLLKAGIRALKGAKGVLLQRENLRPLDLNRSFSLAKNDQNLTAHLQHSYTVPIFVTWKKRHHNNIYSCS